jgi:hypothetical protein
VGWYNEGNANGPWRGLKPQKVPYIFESLIRAVNERKEFRGVTLQESDKYFGAHYPAAADIVTAVHGEAMLEAIARLRTDVHAMAPHFYRGWDAGTETWDFTPWTVEDLEGEYEELIEKPSRSYLVITWALRLRAWLDALVYPFDTFNFTTTASDVLTAYEALGASNPAEDTWNARAAGALLPGGQPVTSYLIYQQELSLWPDRDNVMSASAVAGNLLSETVQLDLTDYQGEVVKSVLPWGISSNDFNNEYTIDTPFGESPLGDIVYSGNAGDSGEIVVTNWPTFNAINNVDLAYSFTAEDDPPIFYNPTTEQWVFGYVNFNFNTFTVYWDLRPVLTDQEEL